MKTIIFFILAIVFVFPLCANATNITFTSSGTISDGDVYDCDSLSIQNSGTVVEMSGGQIIADNLFVRPQSTFNIADGTMDVGQFVVEGNLNISGGGITDNILKTYYDSIINITGGSVDITTLDVHGEINIYKGVLNIDEAYVGCYGTYLATINIFCIDYNYDLSTETLTGHLLDGNFFTIGGVSTSEYTRFNLIPEPVSVLLFGLGLLSLRTSKK